MTTQTSMAKRHRVDVRTLYRDASWIRNRWKEGHESITPAEERAAFLERLRAAQFDAAKKGFHTAQGRMMMLEAQVCGHNQPVQVEVTHRAQQMSRVDQAKLILSRASEARSFLKQAAPEQLEELEPNVIEVACE